MAQQEVTSTQQEAIRVQQATIEKNHRQQQMELEENNRKFLSMNF